MIVSGPFAASQASMAALAASLTDAVEGSDPLVLKKAITPPLPFRGKITTSDEWSVKEQVESKFYWGVQFEHPETLLRKNTNAAPNSSVASFTKYFPDFSPQYANFVTGSNEGDADTAEQIGRAHV